MEEDKLDVLRKNVNKIKKEAAFLKKIIDKNNKIVKENIFKSDGDKKKLTEYMRSKIKKKAGPQIVMELSFFDLD